MPRLIASGKTMQNEPRAACSVLHVVPEDDVEHPIEADNRDHRVVVPPMWEQQVFSKERMLLRVVVRKKKRRSRRNHTPANASCFVDAG